MMPDMDGIETFYAMQSISHNCKNTPVVILTANATSGAREMYLEHGFAEYLAKQFDLFRVHIHSIKSTSKTIGAMKVYEKALMLENAAKENLEDVISTAYPEFVDLHEALLLEIKSFLSHQAQNS